MLSTQDLKEKGQVKRRERHTKSAVPRGTSCSTDMTALLDTREGMQKDPHEPRLQKSCCSHDYLHLKPYSSPHLQPWHMHSALQIGVQIQGRVSPFLMVFLLSALVELPDHMVVQTHGTRDTFLSPPQVSNCHRSGLDWMVSFPPYVQCSFLLQLHLYLGKDRIQAS